MVNQDLDPERLRLEQDGGRTHNWKRWGPYLSERQWGTVREDYSPDGTAWDYFPHDHARSRAYRWGEDGLAGISRPPPVRLLRARAVERPGPDPEGATLRPDRHRGQSRRGREGVLLLSRLHADALLHEGPLQVSAGRVPLPAAGRGEPPPRAQRPGVRADRHAASSTRTATSTSSSSTPRRRPTTCCIRVHVCQPRTRGRRPLHAAADALVPQHLVLGTRTPGGPRLARGRRRQDARGRSTSSSEYYGLRRLLLRGRARACSSPRTRPTPAVSGRRRTNGART